MADMKALVAVVIPLVFLLWNKSKKKYPPGAKRLPLFGNLFDLPSHHAGERFAQFSKDLDSDIVYLDALGKPFIILNFLEACNDLLEKRSNIYSSRFHMTMAYDPQDNSKTPVLICHVCSVAVLAEVSGLPIKRVNDPWIALSEESMTQITAAVVPGKYVVDALPFLKYIPEWFPGAGFKKEAREDGTVRPSYLSRSPEEVKKGDGAAERLIENIGDMHTAGGTDTSVTAVQNLFIILLLFPEIQVKGQAELDSVVGHGRLPDFEDKPHLPYITAVLKGLLRWRPVVPTGLPHMITEDDEYRGYFIPKGSIVVGNTWCGCPLRQPSAITKSERGIMHDEKTFPEPSKFDPTRFLTPDGRLKKDKSIPDPEMDATFGFGRRKCVGLDFGLDSYWLGSAYIVACFHVTPELDEKGNTIPPKFEYLGKEVIDHPEPFKCRIKPRSEEVVALIRAGYDETSEYI
ncbi:O-methylsterigmatocystin oxidoreductase [Leucoagaricus sp. SymC.cos]|nr:O-methylsterigmatocystin oxidoreductase [Leucoagaricus sp. SymC.cos]